MVKVHTHFQTTIAQKPYSRLGQDVPIKRIHRGYYTAARRYEFYFRVVKTIFYKRAQRVSKILLFYHSKIKFISSSHRVIFFLLYRQESFCTKNSVKAGNDVIDILTSEEDMENTPLESPM